MSSRQAGGRRSVCDSTLMRRLGAACWAFQSPTARCSAAIRTSAAALRQRRLEPLALQRPAPRPGAIPVPLARRARRSGAIDDGPGDGRRAATAPCALAPPRTGAETGVVCGHDRQIGQGQEIQRAAAVVTRVAAGDAAQHAEGSDAIGRRVAEAQHEHVAVGMPGEARAHRRAVQRDRHGVESMSRRFEVGVGAAGRDVERSTVSRRGAQRRPQASLVQRAGDAGFQPHAGCGRRWSRGVAQRSRSSPVVHAQFSSQR